MNSIYSSDFYKDRHNSTQYAANKILNILSRLCPPFSSVLDVGCGVGTWLSFFYHKGISVSGIDGPWVPHEYLEIPETFFLVYDLQDALKKKDSGLYSVPKHDLAISLEVAEHIGASCASQFINFLTTHADYILFSAAIPGQTGDGHVNEQWPSYWADKFAKYDFVLFDVIRHEIWDDENIPFWYRQNCFLCARKGLLDLPFALHPGDKKFDIVHPRQFEFIQAMHSVPSFWQRVKNKIFR